MKTVDKQSLDVHQQRFGFNMQRSEQMVTEMQQEYRGISAN